MTYKLILSQLNTYFSLCVQNIMALFSGIWLMDVCLSQYELQ